MKIKTPEISWHAKEAIYSIDIQTAQKGQPHRLATGGIDSNVRVGPFVSRLQPAGLDIALIHILFSRDVLYFQIWELKPCSKTGIVFLSNLSRHERAVNAVRFSKCGKTLASGGDGMLHC